MIMSRSNIKTFDDFKGDKYVDDIEGILVELKDKGFEFDIEETYYGFSIGIFRWESGYPVKQVYDYFKLTDVVLKNKNMKNLKNENNSNLPFKSDLLNKDSKVGKYELYTDESTGWGIIFPNGYIEVEEGPHESTGFMNGEINGVSVTAKGHDVPRIPDEYWLGEMTRNKLARFFDDVINKYKNITKEPFRYKM